MGVGFVQLICWSDGNLLPMLEQQLDPALYQQLHSATAAAAAATAACPDSSTRASSSGSSAAPVQQLRSQLVALLYSTANICSGYEVHKEAVMNSKIPTFLLHHLKLGSIDVNSSRPGAAGGEAAAAVSSAGALDAEALMCDVRSAAVWCIINLLWSDKSPAAPAAEAGAAAACSHRSQGVEVRAKTLKDMGFEQAMMELLSRICTRTAEASAASAAAGQSASPADRAGAASVSEAAPLPPLPPRMLDAGSQDLTERLRTALEQLAMK